MGLQDGGQNLDWAAFGERLNVGHCGLKSSHVQSGMKGGGEGIIEKKTL